jgi:hypothetical protein
MLHRRTAATTPVASACGRTCTSGAARTLHCYIRGIPRHCAFTEPIDLRLTWALVEDTAGLSPNTIQRLRKEREDEYRL